MRWADIKEKLGAHKEQVDKGLDKAGDAAKQKFEGQSENIDRAVGKAKDMTSGGESSGGE